MSCAHIVNLSFIMNEHKFYFLVDKLYISKVNNINMPTTKNKYHNDLNYKNTVLLLMSSGTFGGLDLEEIAKSMNK